MKWQQKTFHMFLHLLWVFSQSVLRLSSHASRIQSFSEEFQRSMTSNVVFVILFLKARLDSSSSSLAPNYAVNSICGTYAALINEDFIWDWIQSVSALGTPTTSSISRPVVTRRHFAEVLRDWNQQTGRRMSRIESTTTCPWSRRFFKF